MEAPGADLLPWFPHTYAVEPRLPKPKVASSILVVRSKGFPLHHWVSRVWVRVSGPKVASTTSRGFTGILKVAGGCEHLFDTARIA